MPKKLSLALSILLLLCANADAHGVRFLGGHPIAAKYGGGYCLIDAPHLHVYPPDHPNLYQRVGDQLVFSADPTPFGYEGEKHAFYGHHPVRSIGDDTVICYLDGPHYHAFPPSDGPGYETKKGVAFYVGAFPPAYVKLRPARERAVNVEYRPYVAMRPTIEVTPPEHWQGEPWIAPPTVVVGGPSVEVSAPGFAVVAPPPPSIVVRGPRIQAPSAVIVGPPGVYVGGPSVEVSGGVYIDERGHHDNGKHKGWGKHGHGHGHD